jgi:hypothetical protein
MRFIKIHDLRFYTKRRRRRFAWIIDLTYIFWYSSWNNAFKWEQDMFIQSLHYQHSFVQPKLKTRRNHLMEEILQIKTQVFYTKEPKWNKFPSDNLIYLSISSRTILVFRISFLPSRDSIDRLDWVNNEKWIQGKEIKKIYEGKSLISSLGNLTKIFIYEKKENGNTNKF